MNPRSLIFTAVGASLALALASPAAPLGPSFTFQGRLDSNGLPADGVFDLEISLFDAPSGGVPVAPPVFLPARTIKGGQFSADLDFGGPERFDGTAYWIGMRVTLDGVTSELPDRVPLRPSPYSLHAMSAASVAAGGVNSAALAAGSVTQSKLATGAVGIEQISALAPPAPGQVLGFNGTGLAWLTSGDGGGATGPAPWILSGPEPHLTWTDTLSGKSASVSSAGGSLYYRVPKPDGVITTAGYVDANGMVTRGRLSVEADDPAVTWDDQGVRASITSASGSLYYRVPKPDGAITTAGFVDHQGLVSNGRVFAQGDVTATRLVLRADPVAPTNAAVLCEDPGVTQFVPYNTALNRAMSIVTHDASVRTLTIRGGADLAEPFAMSHDGVEPGTVVVIDEANPGKLRRSTKAYDKKVAGIVSGAKGIQPGIRMIQEDKLEGGENVALSGRVYVKAEAGGGPIEPGDSLTTSAIEGYAMKASDPAKSQGAILGKAMTGLEEGRGEVLVLVTLQ